MRKITEIKGMQGYRKQAQKREKQMCENQGTEGKKNQTRIDRSKKDNINTSQR